MDSSFYKDFLYAFIAIFPITNPIAMSSVFYAITRRATQQQRSKLALQISTYGAALLIAAVFIGPWLLMFFGLNTPDIRVAGGLIVFTIAWGMLHPKADAETDTIETGDENVMRQAFYPLTMPLTAGGGTLAIVVALATQAAREHHPLGHVMAVIAAIVVIYTIVYFSYRYSAKLFKLLGNNGSKAVTAISAFLLLAIGISVIWSGLRLYLLSLGLHG